MGFEIKCVPVLDKMPCCCCSCDLRTATISLGYIALFVGMQQIVTISVNLANFDEEKAVPSYESLEALVARLVSSAVSMVICALLLYGAHEERPVFMLPSLILDMISIVVTALAVVITGIVCTVANIIVGLIILVGGGLLVALMSFFWVVIYSYYRRLEEHLHPRRGAPLGMFVAGKTSDQEQQLYCRVLHN